MPRVSRRSAKRRAGVSYELTLALRIGIIDDGDGPRKVTGDEAAEWWADDQVREAVMAEHAEHHTQGLPSRPWCWWYVEQGRSVPGAMARGVHDAAAEAAELERLGALTAEERQRIAQTREQGHAED